MLKQWSYFPNLPWPVTIAVILCVNSRLDCCLLRTLREKRLGDSAVTYFLPLFSPSIRGFFPYISPQRAKRYLVVRHLQIWAAFHLFSQLVDKFLPFYSYIGFKWLEGCFHFLLSGECNLLFISSIFWHLHLRGLLYT